MIMMRQPSVSLNSHDVPGPAYSMWRTLGLPERTSPGQVAHYIRSVCGAAVTEEGTGLYNVIINCHGGSGLLLTGGKGNQSINSATLGVFGSLKGLRIGTIWLVACEAAKGSDGIAFCSMLAKVTSCLVIASDEEQEVGAYGTYRLVAGRRGQIDDYEGSVYAFYPAGTVGIEIDPEEVSAHTVLS